MSTALNSASRPVDVISGSIGSPAFKIGTVTLTSERTFRRLYETAAWHQDIVVPAGATADLATNGYYVFATFHGTKGSSNFTSRLGAHYGTPKIDEGVGDPDTYTLQAYAYEAANAIADGSFLGGADVRFDEGFAVAAVELESFTQPGATRMHWKLVRE